MDKNGLVETLKGKIIPLLFYSCDDDNAECARLIWSGMRRSLASNDEPNILGLVNVKKAFVPKLISLLKAHANGNANSQNIEAVYTGLGELVRRIGQTYEACLEDKLAFYKDIIGKLFDAVVKDTGQGRFRFTQDTVDRSRKITAFFECLHEIFCDIFDKSCAFISEINTKYVSLDRKSLHLSSN